MPEQSPPPDHQPVPASAREPIRFTPRPLCDANGAPLPGAPVYVIRLGRGVDRPLYRLALGQMGASIVQPDQVRATLREAVTEAAPENQADILAALDRLALVERDGDADPADLRLIEHVTQFLRPYHQPLATLIAAQEHYNDLAPIAAARVFLKGWESEPMPAGEASPYPPLPAFQQTLGMVPLSTLELLPEDHVLAIGWRALIGMQLAREQEKNSLSPSRSAGTPAASAAAPIPPMAVRAGKSSAKSTRKIRASG